MPWNEKESQQRVDDNDFHDFEVTVSELSKTMDFANLSTKDVRRAAAAHLYVDIPNFHLHVTDAGSDKNKQRKLLRAASVLRTIQTELLKSPDLVSDDPLGRIQLQAARLHALCFKPYDDEAKRASRAVATAITMNTYVSCVFNQVFSDLERPFHSAVGIASGKSLIANLGIHGDRERICLGTPANLAAKVLGKSDTITISEAVFQKLDEKLKEHFHKQDELIAETVVYMASGLRWDLSPELATHLKVKWDPAVWKKKTEDRRETMPLDSMEVSWAEAAIDLEKLTERNNKRTEAISIYADLDGFTRYVQEAEKDEDVVSLVRELHMIRREFHSILDRDYPGVVLQHQGDRVFAILNEPFGDDEGDHKRRCRKALDAAIAIQSSMQHVLRKKLPKRESLYVSIGLDVGVVLVTRLGSKGKREVICLGTSVTSAEKLQMISSAKQIRIAQEIYDSIDREAIRENFTRSGAAYVSEDLTFPKIEESEATKAANEGTLEAVNRGGRIEVVTTARTTTKPWLKDVG